MGVKEKKRMKKIIEKMLLVAYAIALSILSALTVATTTTAQETQQVDLPQTSSARRYEVEQEVQVICNVDSEYSIIINRNATMRKGDNQIRFEYKINGDIAGNEEVFVYVKPKDVFDSYGNEYKITSMANNKLILRHEQLNLKTTGIIKFDKKATEDIPVVLDYEIKLRGIGVYE